MTAHVVLGMHRSGTSLLTSLLQLAGCDLGPADERGATGEANPAGFHENRHVVELNEAALVAAGARWFDVLAVVEGGLDLIDRGEFERRADAALLWTSPGLPWAVKDPRMVPLFPLWLSYLGDPVVVLPLRDPAEVAMSLHVRDGMPLTQAAALWEFHVVHSLEQSRGLNRHLVVHRNLLADPVGETRRLVTSMADSGVAVPNDEDVLQLVDGQLHRNRREDMVDSSFVTDAQRALYEFVAGAVDLDDAPTLAVSPGALDELQRRRSMLSPSPLPSTMRNPAPRRTAVVVQGCRLPVFEPSIRAIRETWAARDHRDVDVYFTYGNACADHELTPLETVDRVPVPVVPDGDATIVDDLLLVGCSDLIAHRSDALLRKRLLSLAHLLATDTHDAFLLVCASSYVDLHVLAEHVSDLDLDMRFQGPTFVAETGGVVVSGSAMLLSRDLAQRLVADGPHLISASNYRYADDVSISDWVASRISDADPGIMVKRVVAGEAATSDNTFRQPPVPMLNYVQMDVDQHVKVPGSYHYHFATDRPAEMRRFHQVNYSAPVRTAPVHERTIFIQIASYRDRELPRTIANAVALADHPERLRFGICWQYDEGTFDDLEPWMDDDRFRVDEVYYRKSDGCTWARSRANALFSGEDYYLQIDAHMRFDDGWDTRLIDMLEGIDAAKPVLTAYPPGYHTDGEGNDELADSARHVLALDTINTDLQTRQCTRIAADQSAPGKSPFVAAGFLFARGSFCEEIPYDPFGYFAGEEIALAARAFTWGYDFFHPSEVLVWHRYNHDEPLHWTDNADALGAMEARSKDRLATLLLGGDRELGAYGLGPIRSLASFENYCGIDFAAASRGEWLPRSTELKLEIDLDVSGIDFGDEFEVWVFALLASDGRELLRRDIVDREVLTGAAKRVEVVADFDIRPTKYLLWPKSRSKGFGERVIRDLKSEASAVDR